MVFRLLKRVSQYVPGKRVFENAPGVKQLVSSIAPGNRLYRSLHQAQSLIKEYKGAHFTIDDKDIIMHTPSGISLYYSKTVLKEGIFTDYEKATMDLIAKRMSKGGVFFDVGANIGWFTLTIGMIPGVVVHSFEPVSSSVESLRRNILLNGLGQSVIVNPVAVTQNSGSVFMKTDSDVTNYILPGKSTSSKKVSAVSLDDYISKNKLSRIDVIKADIEGAELLMLKGAKKTLMSLKPDVVLEIESGNVAHFSYSPQEIFGVMESYGYVCRWVCEEKLKSKFTGLEKKTDYRHNYYFVHKDIKAS